MRIEHNQQQPIQLVQITDPHLGDQPGDALLGMDTDASLNQVIALIEQQRSPDLLLATGDISNGGTSPSYRRFHQMTQRLAEHNVWLPGNHDHFSTMQATMKGSEVLARTVQIGNWQVVMLNSAVVGKVGGSLAAGELDFLRNVLQQAKGEHVLVCLHHHPIASGCAWLDDQQLENADQFFKLLDSFSHIRGVLWGHIHQEIDQWRNGVRLLASPSTCVQFAPNNDNFKLDRLNPGYRWLELHKDGLIETGIERLTAVEFDIDYEGASGY